MLGWPVPPARPGVCRVCHGPARDGRPECWCCRATRRALGGAGAPVVVPVALYRPGDELNAALRRYKDAPVAVARRHHAAVLARALDAFVVGHGPCLRRAGVGWDALAVVPSSSRAARGAAAAGPATAALGRVAHPLDAVCDATGALDGVARLALSPGPGVVGHLRPSAEAFVADGDVAGRHVLIVDDTWTTGAHALSAAAALTRSGATVTAVLVIGRVVDPGAAPGVAAWWRCHVAAPERALADRARRCCLESCGVGTGGRSRERSAVPR
jgi:hypothetical protein